jgi:hypothetical protein
MRPHADAAPRNRVLHAAQIALERVQVEHERRRVHFLEPHAGAAGARIASGTRDGALRALDCRSQGIATSTARAAAAPPG